MKSTSRRNARGFTLIEALVALLALSIGLLGVAGLQITGLRANVSSAWRSQATYLSYDIIDRMRANRGQLDLYDDVALGGVPAVGGLPQADIAAWKANLAATLPGGDGTVDVDGRDVVVTVQWDDSRGTDDPLVFTMRSRL